MNSKLKPVVMAVLILFLFGFIFPTVTSLVADHAIPFKANGSLIKQNGTIYGSYLLAEAFNASFFFQPRPSDTNYNLSESGGPSGSLGSNLTLNQTLQYLHQFMSMNPGINVSEIPYAMVAPSASGLDPNIPVQGAEVQEPRIERSISSLFSSRGKSVNESAVYSFLNETIRSYEEQNFPLFGSYYVNTVQLNLAIIGYLQKNGVLPPNVLG
ncbi:MAG TPA: potassium-transporting ATPase subunit C [Thermoplasmataceae archaeon]|nr:potassium-transporting ATPase subunit C [Thermoplasmataceae archaeon]